MSSKLQNIDIIIKTIKPKLKEVIKISKYDGITAECAVASSKSANKGIEEIKKICQELKLNPISVEVNKEKKNIFVLQFPEMIPEYTEDQVAKLYKANFKWLLDNINSNDKTILKQITEKNKSVLVKSAITSYYRSNTNQYKENINNYLNNFEYRRYIQELLDIYLDGYFAE